MTTLRIYNTLSKSLQTFTPLEADHVKLFVCGPTVHGAVHLGHAKTYVQFDIIARILRELYPRVTYLQNITDVDDKIIKKAATAGQDVVTFAREWEEHYHSLMKLLGNDQVTAFPRAHDHIPEVIDQVARMLAADVAYIIEGDGVYFSLEAFPSYGHLTPPRDQQESRLEDTSFKRSPGDFVLWKFSKEGEPSWEAPFGAGRPGWHIEDTAITERYLGSSYDIHGGATDLIFPHHEAEIAQMESLTGEPLAHYWLHTGLLTVGGKKMGKSEGNAENLQDLLTRWDAKVVRFHFARNHYRAELALTEEHLAVTKRTKEGLEEAYRNAPETGEGVYGRFFEALKEDFNMPKALSLVFIALRDAPATVTKGDFEKINHLLGDVLDLEAVVVPKEVEELAERRQAARLTGDWTTSDGLRQELHDAGWEMRDSKEGYSLHLR